MKFTISWKTRITSPRKSIVSREYTLRGLKVTCNNGITFVARHCGSSGNSTFLSGNQRGTAHSSHIAMNTSTMSVFLFFSLYIFLIAYTSPLVSMTPRSFLHSLLSGRKKNSAKVYLTTLCCFTCEPSSAYVCYYILSVDALYFGGFYYLLCCYVKYLCVSFYSFTTNIPYFKNCHARYLRATFYFFTAGNSRATTTLRIFLLFSALFVTYSRVTTYDIMKYILFSSQFVYMLMFSIFLYQIHSSCLFRS